VSRERLAVIDRLMFPARFFAPEHNKTLSPWPYFPPEESIADLPARSLSYALAARSVRLCPPLFNYPAEFYANEPTGRYVSYHIIGTVVNEPIDRLRFRFPDETFRSTSRRPSTLRADH